MGTNESAELYDLQHYDSDGYMVNKTGTDFHYTTMHIYLFTPEYNFFLGIAAVFLCVLGVLGNMLTLAATAQDKLLRRSKASWLIASLAASDLISCLIVLPFNAQEFFGIGTILNSAPLLVCRIEYFFMAAPGMLGILSLLLITLNRYIAVVHNPWYKKVYGTKSIVLQILFVWLLSYMSMLPPLLNVDEVITFDEASLHCSGNFHQTWGEMSLATKLSWMVNSVWHGIVYILLMIGFYIRIFLHVRGSRKKVESFLSARQNNTCTVAWRTSIKPELRVAKTMMITLVVLILSTTPLIGLAIYGRYEVPMGVTAFAYIAAHSATTTNFIIYAAWHPHYRRAYMIFLQNLSRFVRRTVV